MTSINSSCVDDVVWKCESLIIDCDVSVHNRVIYWVSAKLESRSSKFIRHDLHENANQCVISCEIQNKGKCDFAAVTLLV